jgi:hypothetical protein
MNCVGVGGGDSTANLEILPSTFCKKIRETLKSVLAIFDVFSRYRSIPGDWGEYSGGTSLVIESIYSGKIHNSIEFSTPVATWKVVCPLKNILAV